MTFQLSDSAGLRLSCLFAGTLTVAGRAPESRIPEDRVGTDQFLSELAIRK